MKTIGLIGGMTPESTKVYYELLIRGARQPGANPLRNPVILIYSLDLAEVVRIQRSGDRGGVVAYLADLLERLRLAGAEVGALTANTPHAYLDELRAATSLPIVSIVSATRDAAASRRLERALLLGTRTTVEAEMYPREFAAAGIETFNLRRYRSRESAVRAFSGRPAESAPERADRPGPTGWPTTIDRRRRPRIRWRRRSDRPRSAVLRKGFGALRGGE